MFDGSLTTIRAHETNADGELNPTYRCLFPEPPPEGTVPSCAKPASRRAGRRARLDDGDGSDPRDRRIRRGAGRAFIDGGCARDAVRDAGLQRDPSNPLNGDHPTIRDLSAYPQAEQPLEGGRFWLPRSCSGDDGIDEDEEFSGTCDESHFVGFTIGSEAIVEGDELKDSRRRLPAGRRRRGWNAGGYVRPGCVGCQPCDLKSSW